jgi:hypothetical protein
VLMASLSFALGIVPRILCSCFCFFDAIIQLHPMVEGKKLITLSLERKHRLYR